MFVNNKMPNEALYGRAGYLIGLLALRDAGYEVLEELIRKVSTSTPPLVNTFDRYLYESATKSGIFSLLHASALPYA